MILSAPLVHRPHPNSSSVLLTGATGFIGSNLALHLLLTTQAQLFCLVRPSRQYQTTLIEAVRQAAQAAAIGELIEDHLDRLIAIPGDLTELNLNLRQADLATLRESRVRELWHSAASLKFEACHQPEIFEKNVAGVQRVLELGAALQIEQFNHISTAYVAGKRQGVIPEAPYDEHYEANNWYETSKRHAEHLVLNAGQRGLFRVKIFRPSIVIGNSTTFDGTSTSGFYGFIAAIEQFKQQLDLKHPGYLAQHPLNILVAQGVDSGLNLMPVDILVKEALTLAQDPQQTQTFYHLTNPFSVTLETIRLGLASVYPNFQIAGVTEMSQLQLVDQLFHRRLRFYQPYLQDDKHFERHRDGNDRLHYLQISASDLERYIQHFSSRIHWQREQSA